MKSKTHDIPVYRVCEGFKEGIIQEVLLINFETILYGAIARCCIRNKQAAIDSLSLAMQQSCMFFRSSVRLPSRDPSRNHTSNLDLLGQGCICIPIGPMYGIYANIWGILMVNVTIYSIHGSYGIYIYIYICLYVYIQYIHEGSEICLAARMPKVVSGPQRRPKDPKGKVA